MRFGNDGRGVITGSPNGTTRVSQAPNGGMRFEMSRMTMPALAEMLAPFVDRPVIDATRLKGTYQVTLDLPRWGPCRRIRWVGRRCWRRAGRRQPGGRAGPRSFVSLSVGARTRSEAPVR